MTSNQKNVVVFVVTAIVLSLGFAMIVNIIGSGSDALHLLLRVSGRVSLLIFLAVFIASPLQQLVASDSATWLLRNRRYVGIAFAASHTVHLGLILWLAQSMPEEVFDTVTIVVGGGGFFLMYLMLITSFDRPARAIGMVAWRRLHRLGLYWIGFIFAVDFFIKPLSAPSVLPYLPFSLLVLLAISIRVIAWRARREATLNPA